MSFVMMKAEHAISDRHYLMDIPATALVVAPPEFFERFGTSFSKPTRDQVIADLAQNLVFHAVPSDKGRADKTPFVVRRIPSSKVKDALAGKLATELIRPVDHVAPYLNQLLPPEQAEQVPFEEKVNVYKCTSAELTELAKKYKIPAKIQTTRKQTEKAILAAMAKETEEIEEAGEIEETEEGAEN